MNRAVKYDYLRAIACIGVVFIHVLYSCNLVYGQDNSKSENIVNNTFLNNVMWAVPVFFTITGALLLKKEKKISFKKLYLGYIVRILIALLFFGTIFSLCDTFFGQEKPGFDLFINNFYKVIKGESWSHLWYLYCILGIYFLLPFYKMIADNCSGREILYLLSVYFVFLSIMPLLAAFNIKIGFYIHVSSIYPFYLFLGFFIDKYGSKIKTSILIMTFVMSTLFISLFTYLSVYYDKSEFAVFFKYNSVFVILQTFAVVGLFFKLKDKAAKVLHFILYEINKNSFGIYLFHMILVRIFYKHMNINPYNYGGIAMIIAVVLAVIILSDVSVRIIKLVPVFKKIF